MRSGVCQADAAVLVIDGSTGEFESSFQGGGQVIEHAILVRSLGVQQLIVAVNKVLGLLALLALLVTTVQKLIVAVNKLDNVNYSEERFKFIVAQLAPFLKSSGYKSSDVQFVPCSAFKGENLVKVSEASLASWYTGPTLLGAIDLLKSPVRLKDLPVRLSLSDIFKTTALGTCVAGRVEGGTIAVGARLICRPGDLVGQVRALEGRRP
jgi:elongation factor 1 alpha-like protein